LSLGGPGCSSAIGAAVAYAKTEGRIVVAAAGNDNVPTEFSPASFDDEVIAVAATNNVDAKASYSNYGTYVDIAAPGGEGDFTSATRILSSYKGNSYAIAAGTSMAAPFVSAAVALRIEKCGVEPFSIVHDLLASTASVTVPGWTFKRLDANAYVTAPCTP
jgi:subtilisin family serine protease